MGHFRWSNLSHLAKSLCVFVGWGQYLAASLSIPVVNDAVGGRSARSFTREGCFTKIINTVKAGDIVVIELGHNDGGSLTPTDNRKSDCTGSGAETCKTTYGDVSEIVLTFPSYLENAAKAIKAKGVSVVISPQTPDNPYETGKLMYVPCIFTDYAKLAASTTSVGYVDHGQYTANAFHSCGASAVDAYFPNDHTHTSPACAIVVANAFVKGLLCGSTAIEPYVTNLMVEGSCI
ncbi:hypothetical protein VF21_01215 [Pseudogymnoascus sp. 05NY08]|nr:hypothetical protein VF21_01215 [Pseudogymnoascus sp. 05NY08]